MGIGERIGERGWGRERDGGLGSKLLYRRASCSFDGLFFGCCRFFLFFSTFDRAGACCTSFARFRYRYRCLLSLDCTVYSLSSFLYLPIYSFIFFITLSRALCMYLSMYSFIVPGPSSSCAYPLTTPKRTKMRHLEFTHKFDDLRRTTVCVLHTSPSARPTTTKRLKAIVVRDSPIKLSLPAQPCLSQTKHSRIPRCKSANSRPCERVWTLSHLFTSSFSIMSKTNSRRTAHAASVCVGLRI